ncbi:Recombinase zinc beta ribbon domain-containing protein [Paenibacillus sp. UNCCL117]|uniref:recombinase zinc beta ribbon domain-containing protein n=1 Tax=unclassified Paenibacillus TaxID=185978 RepID=UPI000889720A|nr:MULTISPECIES: recombinase zinc beta ribbon domain-containing protein [unclassified Paenibacillus]SDC47141.1 Recombinase zinc beta ribbon domain-containing protein [Paenibacillus sp. cl123]SFW12186.1 Recombinase zinc beta ribbon domain-containing protein [Paenibacillus sp. UNCCL117]
MPLHALKMTLSRFSYRFTKGADMSLFASLLCCKHCGASYRGSLSGDICVYGCLTHMRKGTGACANSFRIQETELVHMVTTHLQLNGQQVRQPLRQYVKRIDVENGGYRIYYYTGGPSIVNDNSSRYGTKFKY